MHLLLCPSWCEKPAVEKGVLSLAALGAYRARKCGYGDSNTRQRECRCHRRWCVSSRVIYMAPALLPMLASYVNLFYVDTLRTDLNYFLVFICQVSFNVTPTPMHDRITGTSDPVMYTVRTSTIIVYSISVAILQLYSARNGDTSRMVYRLSHFERGQLYCALDA